MFLCDSLRDTWSYRDSSLDLESGGSVSTRITATRRLQYAIGHRVHGHEGKCAHLHGHNFVFFLTAEGINDVQDQLGRVIDFGVLKEKLGSYLEANWDHGMVLWEQDLDAIKAIEHVKDQKYFLLPDNPTAENLAAYVLHVVGPQRLHGTNVRLVKVEIYETENGIATAELVIERMPEWHA